VKIILRLLFLKHPVRLVLRPGRVLRRRQPGAAAILSLGPRVVPHSGHTVSPLWLTSNSSVLPAASLGVRHLRATLPVTSPSNLTNCTRASRPRSVSPPRAAESDLARNAAVQVSWAGAPYPLGPDRGRWELSAASAPPFGRWEGPARVSPTSTTEPATASTERL
jgi:hypothetical protein